MPKSTHPIVYVYEFEGHILELERVHIGSAYARNGNVSNPTEYFNWTHRVDGALIGTTHSRASAYEHARAKVLGIDYYDHPNFPHRARGIRNYILVQQEMRANYRSRKVSAA